MTPRHALFLIAFSVFAAGCDVHRTERAEAQQRLEAATTQMRQAAEAAQSIEQQLTQRREEVAAIGQTVRAIELELSRIRDEVARYVLDNKLASVAVATTTAGLGRVFSNLPEQDRAAAAVPAAIAVGYCLFNAADCTDAAARLGWFMTRIESVSQQLDEARTAQRAAAGELADIAARRDALGAVQREAAQKASEARGAIEALACRPPLCFGRS